MYFVTLGTKVFATHYPATTEHTSRSCLVGFKDKLQAMRLKSHIQKSKNESIFFNDNVVDISIERLDYKSTTFETMMHLNNFCLIDVDSFQFDSTSHDIHIQGRLTCTDTEPSDEHAMYFEQLYKN